MTKHFWCEDCDNRWESEYEEKDCPRCNSNQIRITMSKEEAEKLGLK